MTTLNYPGVPGTMLYGGRPKPAPPQPGEGVATTVAVANLSGGALTSAPTTFGFAFPPGAWQPDAHDIHAAVAGTPLTIQTDATALHPDGSVRFAVVTLDAGAMSAGQTKTIDLTTGGKRLGYVPALTAPAVNLVAEATIYGVQRTEVHFGVDGSTFSVNESVTLRLTLDGVDHDYTISVPADGTIGMSVRDALGAVINAGGLFRARIEGMAFTRFTLERIDPLVGGFTVSIIYNGTGSITQSTISSFAPPVLWTASLQAELESQVASSNAGTLAQHKRRLHGPVVSEFRQTVKFRNPSNVEHPFLTAIFDTRLYVDGRQWVDLTLENTGLVTANPTAVHYALDIKSNGTTIHSEPNFWHYSRTRWHKSVWVGGNPSLRVTRDMEYFKLSRAVPNMDLQHVISGAQLDSLIAYESSERAAKAWRGPMASTLLVEYMGMTGDRAEIGLISRYVYDYYATQDERALFAMLTVADNASAFPIHFRDELTGWPAGLDTRPDLIVGQNFPTVPFCHETTATAPETAHQGTFGYHPYLMTGDAYHLDSVMFWASWNLTYDNSAYRFAPGFGNLLGAEQTRGTAWSLRALAEACMVLPANHPRRGYYVSQLEANLANMDAVKGVSWANGPFGAIVLPSAPERADNWHCDYLMLVLGWVALNGSATALSVINHLAEYQFGRALHGADGLCPQWVGDYFQYVSIPGTPTITWNDLAKAAGGPNSAPAGGVANRYGQTCQWGADHDHTPIGTFPAIFRSAASMCADAGDSAAAAAHTLFAALTPELATSAGFAQRKWASTRRI